MTCESKQWSAVARREGERRRLRVEGRMECLTDGHRLELAPTNEGIYDDPKVIALRLRITEPENATEIISEEVVVWETTIDDEVETIRVRIDGTMGQRLTVTNEE